MYIHRPFRWKNSKLHEIGPHCTYFRIKMHYKHILLYSDHFVLLYFALHKRGIAQARTISKNRQNLSDYSPFLSDATRFFTCRSHADPWPYDTPTNRRPPQRFLHYYKNDNALTEKNIFFLDFQSDSNKNTNFLPRLSKQ
jgi:hypothetical protein